MANHPPVFTSGSEPPFRGTPYTQYLHFLRYHADPLPKKEVFTMETQVFQEIP